MARCWSALSLLPPLIKYYRREPFLLLVKHVQLPVLEVVDSSSCNLFIHSLKSPEGLVVVTVLKQKFPSLPVRNLERLHLGRI